MNWEGKFITVPTKKEHSKICLYMECPGTFGLVGNALANFCIFEKVGKSLQNKPQCLPRWSMPCCSHQTARRCLHNGQLFRSFKRVPPEKCESFWSINFPLNGFPLFLSLLLFLLLAHFRNRFSPRSWKQSTCGNFIKISPNNSTDVKS